VQVHLAVPFARVVRSMAPRPALLASFLCETVLNDYSFDTLQFVLDRVDLHLSGEAVSQAAAHAPHGAEPYFSVATRPQHAYEEAIFNAKNAVADHYQAPAAAAAAAASLRPTTASHASASGPGDERGGHAYAPSGFWRSSVRGDIPVASYAATPAEAARGPYSVCHRFVSGRYCFVRVDCTAVGDVRIVLSAPTDGKHPASAYGWHPLEVVLTRQETLAFVANHCASTHKGAVYRTPPKFADNVELLAPSYRHELYSVLLSSLALDEAVLTAQLGLLAPPPSLYTGPESRRPAAAAPAVVASTTAASVGARQRTPTPQLDEDASFAHVSPDDDFQYRRLGYDPDIYAVLDDHLRHVDAGTDRGRPAHAQVLRHDGMDGATAAVAAAVVGGETRLSPRHVPHSHTHLPPPARSLLRARGSCACASPWPWPSITRGRAPPAASAGPWAARCAPGSSRNSPRWRAPPRGAWKAPR